MIPERMTRVCAVSIMNACLHELVWVVRASCESAWRLESTTQQQWCTATGYEPGGCCCSHAASARERLLSRRWIGTSCSPARRRFDLAYGAIPRQRQGRGIAGVSARSGWTVASALVPRWLSEKKRSLFSDIHPLPVDHARPAHDAGWLTAMAGLSVNMWRGVPAFLKGSKTCWPYPDHHSTTSPASCAGTSSSTAWPEAEKERSAEHQAFEHLKNPRSPGR